MLANAAAADHGSGVGADSSGVSADSSGAGTDSSGVATDSSGVSTDSSGVGADSSGVSTDSSVLALARWLLALTRKRSGWLRGTAPESRRHHANERNGRSNQMPTLQPSIALLLRRVGSACTVQELAQNFVLIAAAQPSRKFVLDLR